MILYFIGGFFIVLQYNEAIDIKVVYTVNYVVSQKKKIIFHF